MNVVILSPPYGFTSVIVVTADAIDRKFQRVLYMAFLPHAVWRQCARAEEHSRVSQSQILLPAGGSRLHGTHICL